MRKYYKGYIEGKRPKPRGKVPKPTPPPPSKDKSVNLNITIQAMDSKEIKKFLQKEGMEMLIKTIKENMRNTAINVALK